MSIKYYNDNAEQFISTTIDADMRGLYIPFEKYINSDAKILDLGCGAGRDTRHFINEGYEVVSMDGSEKMIDFCKSYLRNEIYNSKFEDFEYALKFDAIWACASLLHVKRENLVEVISKYLNTLNVDGIFFMSFKMREKDYEKDGRIFTCFTKKSLLELIEDNFGVEVSEIIETVDAREGRADEKWISVIIKKYDRAYSIWNN